MPTDLPFHDLPFQYNDEDLEDRDSFFDGVLSGALQRTVAQHEDVPWVLHVQAGVGVWDSGGKSCRQKPSMPGVYQFRHGLNLAVNRKRTTHELLERAARRLHDLLYD